MYDLQEDWLMERFAAEQARFCSMFSNPRRILILWALADKELSVGAIADVVGSSLQNVSQHLSKMKDYRIVTSRREGKTIYYRIESEALANQCLGLLRTKIPESATMIHDK